MNNESPSSNMRRLKRVMSDSGLIYTLETDSERTKDNLLCNYCAAKNDTATEAACTIYKQLDQIEQSGVIPMIRACRAYQPIITFKPRLIGLDREFNTFRIGSAWYNRLMPGVTVGLMNSQTNEIFGKAIVQKVVSGGFEAMCAEHALNNHLMLGLSKETAAQRLEEILRKIYGKFIADQQAKLIATVIYLRNVNCDAQDLQARAASG